MQRATPALVPDTLRVIFSNLSFNELLHSGLKRVCKSWNQVLSDPIFWKQRCASMNLQTRYTAPLGPALDDLPLAKWKDRLEIQNGDLVKFGRPKDILMMALSPTEGISESFLQTVAWCFGGTVGILPTLRILWELYVYETQREAQCKSTQTSVPICQPRLHLLVREMIHVGGERRTAVIAGVYALWAENVCPPRFFEILLGKESRAKLEAELFPKKKLGKDDKKPSTSSAPKAAKPIVPKSGISGSLKGNDLLLSLDPEELARQFSLQLESMLSKLEPGEFLDLSWLKRERNLSKNLKAVIDRFNRQASWTSTCLIQCTDLSARVKRKEYFIKLIHHLVELQNYHDAQAIMSGLQSTSVHKLKDTHEKLSAKAKKRFDEYTNLLAGTQNYRNLRAKFDPNTTQAMPGSLVLMDLTFIEDGNSPYLKSGIGDQRIPDAYAVLNFHRCILIQQTISQFLNYRPIYSRCYQQTAELFRFRQSVPEIQTALESLSFLADEQLYRQACELEPRKAAK